MLAGYSAAPAMLNLTESARPDPRQTVKLQSIRLRNYRCHENLTVEFNSQFNAIAAINGGGKTSLLRAISDGLVYLLDGLGVSTGRSQRHLLSESVRTVPRKIAGRYRYENIYPLAIGLRAEVEVADRIEWTVELKGEINAPSLMPDEAFHHWQSSHGRHAQVASPQLGLLPLVAFYRANRHWPAATISAVDAAQARESRDDAYANWQDAALDAGTLQRWIIAKSLERLQAAVDHDGDTSAIDDDELAAVNQAIRSVLENAAGLRYDMTRKSVVLDWATGRHDSIAFENLSDGQRAIICLVADIGRRACLANPMPGALAPLVTPGIILIDELDVHLHPHWQRLITRGLKAAFPAMQFIVATHSPQVLGELQPEEIILLSRGTTTHPQVSYGLSAAQVLEIIMETDERTPIVEHTLESIFEMLERGELTSAADAITALEHQAAGLPELEQARAVLRRKELIGL